MEWDTNRNRPIRFNSRTPGGVRPGSLSSSSISGSFQFTHPGRGATTNYSALAIIMVVSIHAPREGCDICKGLRFRLALVSIHAPREGCDSIPPEGKPPKGVSIHAPREGCDG